MPRGNIFIIDECGELKFESESRPPVIRRFVLMFNVLFLLCTKVFLFTLAWIIFDIFFRKYFNYCLKLYKPFNLLLVVWKLRSPSWTVHQSNFNTSVWRLANVQIQVRGGIASQPAILELELFERIVFWKTVSHIIFDPSCNNVALPYFTFGYIKI